MMMDRSELLPAVIMKIHQAIVVLSLALSGCIVQRTIVANRAQTELVGITKTQLLSCAGAPHRQERAEVLEFLTYEGGGGSVGFGVLTQTSPSMGVGVGGSNRRYCEATFVLRNGVVQSVNYQGRTGGLITKGEQCAFIVESCLGQPRQSQATAVEMPSALPAQNIPAPRKFPVPLPGGWEESPLTEQMRSNGTLMYAINRTIDAGAVVGATKREGITDVMAFAKSRRAVMENRLVDALSTDFVLTDFHGKPALVSEVSGISTNGLRLRYLMAVVEGHAQIGIVNAWVLSTNFSEQRERLVEFSSTMAQQF